MTDKITTIRSDYYKRRKPGVGSRAKPIKWSEQDGFYKLATDTQNELLDKELKSRFIEANKKYVPEPLESVLFSDGGPDPRKRRDAMMTANPWLAPLLGEIVKSRYDLMTGKESYFNDKNFGWGEDWSAPPDEDEYFKWGRDESGKLVPVPSDKARELEQSNPTEYEFRRKPFADYDEDSAFQLIPLTKEEAETAKLPWYHSTNDYLDAILATRLGESNRRALMEEAHDQFAKYMEDKIESGDISREEAIDLLKDGGFKPESIIKQGVKNLVIPATNAVMGDPELWKKTSTGEAIARGATDAALDLGSVLIPWGATAKLGTFAARPVLAKAGLGALGGLANYGAERGANQAFDTFTGYGTDNQPIDLSDAALSTGIGAVTAPLMNANKIVGGNKVRKYMNKLEPSTVTKGDVKSSIKAAAESGGDVAEASRRHAGSAMKEYRNVYPNAATLVQTPPALVADEIPLATGLPRGRLRDLLKTDRAKKYQLQLGVGDDANFIMGRDPAKRIGVVDASPTTERKLTKKGTKSVTAFDVNFEEPPLEKAAWVQGDDPQFYRAMVKQNPEYYGADFTLEDLEKGLPKAAKEAQKKGTRESEFFGKGDVIMSDDDIAKLRAAYSGNTLNDATDEKMKKAFMAKVLRTKSKPGNIVNGKFSKADPKQESLYNKSLKDYSRRANQKIISESMVKDMMKNDIKTGSLKAIGALGAMGSRNITPLASNWLLGVQPIEYGE